MSKRSQKARRDEHIKHSKLAVRKKAFKHNTMHYCGSCGFGYFLSEYQVCPQCGRAYEQPLKEKLAEEFEEQKSKIPQKERCQWCEIRKFEKTYESVSSNIGKNIRLCKICAIRLGKEKEELAEEKNDAGTESQQVESDTVNA